MSTLTVYNMQGAEIGKRELDDALLVRGRGDQALHEAVLAYQAAQRAGTASTLRKGEVAGSNKKPWRQKGTGRARAGYRQSPVWRGGGAAFGPHPRSYVVKVNRKVARLAFRRALSDSISEGAIRVIDPLAVESPKTKTIAELFKGLGVAGPALMVLGGMDAAVALSARNLPDLEVLEAKDVHPYHLVRYPVVLVSGEGMDVLERRLGTAAEVTV